MISKKNIEKMGEFCGFLTALLIFVSIFYFILNYFGKLPQGILYWHVVLVTLAIYVFIWIIKNLR